MREREPEDTTPRITGHGVIPPEVIAAREAARAPERLRIAMMPRNNWMQTHAVEVPPAREDGRPVDPERSERMKQAWKKRRAASG